MSTSIPHIYVFHGPNTLGIRQKVSAWTTVFNAKYGHANHIDIDVSTSTALASLPLIQNTLTSHTLFSTTALLRITGLFSKTCPAAIRDMLSEKLSHTTSSTFIIIEDEAIDKRLAVYKTLLALHKEGRALIEEFELPTHETLRQWIIGYLKKYNVTIEPIALSLLVEQFEPNGLLDDQPGGDMMWQLSNELHKIIHFTGRKTIHRDDIELLVNIPNTAHVFNLIDAILARQKTRVYTLVHELVSSAPSQEKASVISITTILRTQFRSLLLVKSMKQNAVDDSAIAKILGWNPKRVWVVSKKTSSLSLDQLSRIYRHLLSFEEYLKTYSSPAGASLDILIAQLMG